MRAAPSCRKQCINQLTALVASSVGAACVNAIDMVKHATHATNCRIVYCTMWMLASRTHWLLLTRACDDASVNIHMYIYSLGQRCQRVFSKRARQAKTVWLWKPGRDSAVFDNGRVPGWCHTCCNSRIRTSLNNTPLGALGAELGRGVHLHVECTRQLAVHVSQHAHLVAHALVLTPLLCEVGEVFVV